MDCRKREKQISMLLDGELEFSASDELLAHIAACKTCRSLHERIIALNADMEALAQVSTIPSDLATKVKERISVVKSREYDRHLTLVWRQVPIVVMTVLLAIGVGNLAGRSVSRMLSPERLDSAMEVIMPDAGESLGDLLMGVVPEENNR
jgi:predicted anti-sigma-YlaC factor YlaD